MAFLTKMFAGLLAPWLVLAIVGAMTDGPDPDAERPTPVTVERPNDPRSMVDDGVPF